MHKTNKKGFIAVTAVILLATGTLAFSLSALAAAALYADTVMRRELRIQAGLNVQACMDTAALMAEKDYFISGNKVVQDFGCTVGFNNDFRGHVSIHASSVLSGVASIRDATLTLSQ